MESPGKKFTDLVEIESIQDTDLMVIRNDTGVKKTPMQKLSDYIKQKFIGWVFSDLPTTDKTIPGALKELNSSLEYSTGSITQGTPSWENIEGTIFEKNGCHLHIHGIIKSTTQSNIIILNGIESMNIANDIGIILPYGTSSKEYIGNYYAKVSQNNNSILLTLPKNVEANTYIGMDFVLELL